MATVKPIEQAKKSTARCLAGLLVASAAGGACAQVLEIGDDGLARRIGGGWAPEVAAAAPAAPLAATPFRGAIEAAARAYDLSPELVDAVIRSESGYDPRAVSPAGAVGLMQLMPATAKSLGVDPTDPEQNIRGGAAYLRAQLDRFDGSIDLALAAYNAGPARVARHRAVPPIRETQAYVGKNLDRLAQTSLAQTSPALSPTPTDGATP